MLKIEKLETKIPVFDITVKDNHNFFANDILVHNCQEISLVTKPIEHIDDPNGEIALCILTSINIGLINKIEELEAICASAVRGLDALIDYQDYPVVAAEKTKARRSLGISFTGLAHYLARQKVNYGSKEAALIVHDLAEALQYYSLRASCQLAKEQGACEYFHLSKYAKGILPIDTYKKDVDKELGFPTLKLDWEALRADIKQFGLRNTNLSAQPPVESCQKFSNKLNLSDGRQLNFYEIFDEIGFDYKSLEETPGAEGNFYMLPQPISLIGEDGDELVDKIFYNGLSKTYRVQFDDGEAYDFTGNHRLETHYRQNHLEEDFTKVKNLRLGDEIIHFEHSFGVNTGEVTYSIRGTKTITSIVESNELSQTYDVNTQSGTFLLPNGCVSHNSSLVTNSTNGIEPVRALLIAKKSKKGVIKQIVPQYSVLKNNYTLMWDLPDNDNYLLIVAAIQKFFDQAISVNTNYDPLKFEGHLIPVETVLEDVLNAYRLGVKSLYYCNTKDGKTEESADSAEYEKQQTDMHGSSPVEIVSNEEEHCDSCAV